MKNFKELRLLGWIFVSVIFVLILFLVFYNSLVMVFKGVFPVKNVLYVQKIPVEFEVVESYIIGLSIYKNSSYLKLGQVGRGTGVVKRITITNPFNESVKVLVNLDKNMSKFFSLEDNDFVLNRNESRTIEVFVFVNESEKFGNYSGSLEFVMKKI